jgi:hypothetical protein
METVFARISVTMVRTGAQAAGMQRRFLRRKYNGREQRGINCRKREMGSKSSHRDSLKC